MRMICGIEDLTDEELAVLAGVDEQGWNSHPSAGQW
jgi:hypothetical protein